jgi:putative endonuclease
MKEYYVYILTNHADRLLYIGVTNDLKRRIYEHKNGICEGFTSTYHIDKLVYYEICHNAEDAIRREKQLKKWRREKKIALIEKMNPRWNDLAEDG